MNSHDAKLKCNRSIEKIEKAIKEHRPTLMVGGIIASTPALAKTAIDAGLRMLEPNHPAVGLTRGLFPGVTTMNEAESVRYKLPYEVMLDTVRGLRNMVGEIPYICVGIPGVFTEKAPIKLTEEIIFAFSEAGADGFHQHKSSFVDIEELTVVAHKAGLILDAYIDEDGLLGIQAKDNSEVREYAEKLEKIGVDMIGIMSSSLYKGASSGELNSRYVGRLDTLVETIKIPKIAEGGITLNNVHSILNHGIDILVISTSIDDYIKASVNEVISKFLS